MKVEGNATPKSETYLMDHTLHITYGRNTYRYLVRQWASPCVMHTRGDRCTFLVPLKKSVDVTQAVPIGTAWFRNPTDVVSCCLGRFHGIIVRKRTSGSTAPTLWVLKKRIRLCIEGEAMTGGVTPYTTAPGSIDSPRDT